MWNIYIITNCVIVCDKFKACKDSLILHFDSIHDIGFIMQFSYD